MAITNQQKRLYMSERKKGSTQVVAAAKAGFSERTARLLEKGQCQKQKGKKRRWKTREDPLVEVWEKDCVPFLEKNPSCLATTLLEILQDKEPNRFPNSVLRTLQRRVKQWKALHGPEKEVFFRQIHPPGEMALSDFTKIKKFSILIDGKEFTHLLYHFRLAYSGFCFVKVILGGESYTALTEGLQEALHSLGGSPKIHRTDRLSAAFKNFKNSTYTEVTENYQSFCAHYSMKPTHNNLGKSHENGSIESPHGHFKRALHQALLKRGSFDFESIEEYSIFIGTLVEKENQKRQEKILEEKLYLNSLPKYKAMDYTELTVKVTSSSTINVRLVVYSVPSRLIGSTLKIQLYDRFLNLYLANDFVMTLERVYPIRGKRRARKIDYRHLIPSLKKKPGAFYRSQLRDDLFPSPTYKQLWEIADSLMTPFQASSWIIGILDLALKSEKEENIAELILNTYQQRKTLLTLAQLEKQFYPIPKASVSLSITQHSLRSYDELLSTKGD